MGQIPVITNANERAFLDGVLEVYSEMFSHEVRFYFLDEDNTEINSYGETTEKLYKKPIKLIARVKIEPRNGEKAVNRAHNIAYIRVPTQNLWDNNLPTEAVDLAEMSKGKFRWNGIDYQVIRIQPRSMINNTHIFHEFVCEEIILETDYKKGW